eukprot:SAG31_NODE_38160_length_298_cov_1.040201_1_plen_28_part_10
MSTVVYANTGRCTRTSVSHTAVDGLINT